LICPSSSLIAGATNQIFTAINNDDFAVSISKNNCTDTSNCISVTNVGIINKNALKDFQITPNPTTGIINIKSQKIYKLAAIKIINSIDQTIVKKELTDINIDIDISRFANGIYLLEIMADNKTYRT
jgi:hypothetical protein